MEWKIEHENLEELEKMDTNTELPNLFNVEPLERFAPSMELQAEEISEFFKEIPELEYECWKELDIYERVEAMQKLEDSAAEIAKRPQMDVKSEWMPSNVLGYCNKEKLVISELYLLDSSYNAYRENLKTLFHEGRHAYQNYNLYEERVEENQEIVNAWKENYNSFGYLDVLGDLGYPGYYCQPVEVDARVFAETVINKIGI